MAKNYINFVTRPQYSTLKDEVLHYYSIKSERMSEGFNWLDVLDFTNESGEKINRINIINSNEFDKSVTNEDLTTDLLALNEDSKIAGSIPIFIQLDLHKAFVSKCKNNLFLDYSTVNYSTISSDLFSAYQLKIMQDENNRPIYNPEHFIATQNDLSIINVSHRVFVVSKTLKNRVVNVSPYLLDCSMNDTNNGGNFSFTVSSPTAIYENGTWGKRNHTITKKAGGLEFFHQDVLNMYRVLNEDMQDTPINSFKRMFFDTVLQKYDIVFIRGERLFAEQDEDDIDSQEYCNVFDLEGKNWDLIGLIDTVTSDYKLDSGMVGVNVSGRDLMALFIESTVLNIQTFISYGEGNAKYEGFLNNYISNVNTLKLSKTYDRIFGTVQELFLTQANPIPRLVDWVFDKMGAVPFSSDYNLFDTFKTSNPYKSFNELNWNTLKNSEPYKRNGLWNLVSIWYDESVKNRFLRDDSMASAQGNMLSYITKVCQAPFVEFLTMTIGSYFHLIIRKPPFSQMDYEKLFDSCNRNGSHVLKASRVLNSKFEWDSGDVYTLYRLIPSESIMYGNQSAAYLFPAIALPELMERYDCKALEISNSYMDFVYPDRAYQQALLDLRFLIETNVYKQFSQRGQIIILGDRLIKKGQAVYFEPLDLLCYVTGVSTQYTLSESGVQKLTVLTVERCIRLKYYELYFNIVDFSVLNYYLKSKNKQYSQFKDVSLFKDLAGRPFILEFFEQRLEMDFDNDHTDYLDKLKVLKEKRLTDIRFMDLSINVGNVPNA